MPTLGQKFPILCYSMPFVPGRIDVKHRGMLYLMQKKTSNRLEENRK